MRGLTTFITDIRHCKSKDQEVVRVEKELGKIRGKFTQQKGLSGYQRKKYVWKLLYMYILGYEIDFGHFEAATLINTAKFSEKYTGYIATGILINERDENLHKMIAQSIKEDLVGQNEIHCSLALAMIGALAPKELTE
jgi:AP-2 complex subunit alpha